MAYAPKTGFGTPFAIWSSPSGLFWPLLHLIMYPLASASVVFTFLLSTVIPAQGAPPAPSVDELVAKNIEAKGGAAAIAGIKSLRLTGKLLVNEGQVQFAYAQTKKSPGEVRTE